MSSDTYTVAQTNLVLNFSTKELQFATVGNLSRANIFSDDHYLETTNDTGMSDDETNY